MNGVSFSVRAAKAARINRERDAKRAAQRKAYFETAAAAAMRQAQLMRAAALRQARCLRIEDAAQTLSQSEVPS